MTKVFSLINSNLKNEPLLRLERKYWFEQQVVSDWPSLISLGNFKTTYPQRQVNSLYLDTPDLLSYYQSVNGIHDRYKIRIRWYGQLEQKNTKAQLEIKHKHGELGGKQIYQLKNFSYQAETKTSELKKKLLETLPIQLQPVIDSLQVVLTTTYQRRYYQSLTNQVRLTIDQNFQSSYHLGNNVLNSQLKTQPVEIVELKYSPDQNSEQVANRFGQLLPLQLSQFSKYTWGLESS